MASQPTCSTIPPAYPRPPCSRSEGQCSSRSEAQCSSTNQNSQNEQVQIPNQDPRLQERPSTSRQVQSHQPIYSVIPEGGNLTGTECTICYENPIDSVLYMCGHMCMCYRCAVQQWRGKGGGQCPLCRAQIKDVIRTYKSWMPNYPKYAVYINARII